MPMKSLEWSYQMGVEGRFQEYSATYEHEEEQTALITPGLDSIDKVPIHFIVGGKD